MQAEPPPTGAPRYTLRQGLIACLGVFAGIAVLAFGSFNLGVLLILGSFGSSAVLLFGFPELHFAQPRSLIGGHVVSSAAGLGTLALLGPSWWSLALAVAAALALMMLSRTVHPPAGSNPVIIYLTAPAWKFLLFPTLFGAAAMVAVAVVFHRACRRRYPLYWS